MTESKIKSLLKTETTPLYIFNVNELCKRVRFLKENLSSRVKICYAIKANTFILKELDGLVDFFEICSPGEFRICEKTQLSYEKFVISGVNKETTFIDNIINNKDNIGCFTVESINQFHLLHQAAKNAGQRIKILLRLTSGNQFGLDKELLSNLIEKYKDDISIDIAGIQFFSGTQKKSLKKIKREINLMDQFIDELYVKYNFKVEKLEYGPGFPVVYFEGEQFDEKTYLKEVSIMLESMQYNGEIILELGRSISASCGTYITSVVDTKCNGNEYYAIVDGGMHQFVYYGQSMAMKHPKIRLISSREESKIQNWNICGSLCTVNDFLVKRLPMPSPQVGDALVFENAGAYCTTEGISLFLSRELPSIVMLEKSGNFKIIRKKIQTEILNTPQNYIEKEIYNG